MSNQIIESTKTSSGYTYSLTAKFLQSEDGDTVGVYGIDITGCGECAFLSDISTDFERVHELFLLLSQEQAYPVHLAEIAEDMINEWSQSPKKH